VILGCAESDENDSSEVILGLSGSAVYVALSDLVDDRLKTLSDKIGDLGKDIGSHTHMATSLGSPTGPATEATVPYIPMPGPTLVSVAASNVKAS
jgi:hypothetical protein